MSTLLLLLLGCASETARYPELASMLMERVDQDGDGVGDACAP